MRKLAGPGHGRAQTGSDGVTVEIPHGVTAGSALGRLRDTRLGSLLGHCRVTAGSSPGQPEAILKSASIDDALALSAD